jgi:hypothetical protein
MRTRRQALGLNGPYGKKADNRRQELTEASACRRHTLRIPRIAISPSTPS